MSLKWLEHSSYCDNIKLSKSENYPSNIQECFIYIMKNHKNKGCSLSAEVMNSNQFKEDFEKHNGNITKAAKELGLTRTALYRRLSKYDI